jgi:ADP-ribosylglycohydrolase
MAISIVEVLKKFGHINQDYLAQAFASRYQEEPYRGYGMGAKKLLRRISKGDHWRQASAELFNGGSFGNGGAMRASPIGGFFTGDPLKAAEQARLSAEVTHAHEEGQAGAMAVAAAAAVAAQEDFPTGRDFIETVSEFIPSSQVLSGIKIASETPDDSSETAVRELGTGDMISAQDTVPFCLWIAAYNLHNYVEALWRTAAGLGDRDTTCAIVGGIVALSSRKIPSEWIKLSEPIPADLV